MLKFDYQKNNISLIQYLFETGKITTEYRDKMLLERNNILIEYSRKTAQAGVMLFVYTVNKANKSKYNLYQYINGIENKIISIDKSQLPAETCIDCVLRFHDGTYIFDEKSTIDISAQTNRIIQQLLEKQAVELNKKRIEHHIYEVIEAYKHGALITNLSQNNGECFEEITIPDDILRKINVGSLLQYINGKYEIYQE